jgi:hypothetical protein
MERHRRQDQADFVPEHLGRTRDRGAFEAVAEEFISRLGFDVEWRWKIEIHDCAAGARAAGSVLGGFVDQQEHGGGWRCGSGHIRHKFHRRRKRGLPGSIGEHGHVVLHLKGAGHLIKGVGPKPALSSRDHDGALGKLARDRFEERTRGGVLVDPLNGRDKEGARDPGAQCDARDGLPPTPNLRAGDSLTYGKKSGDTKSVGEGQ